MGRLGVLHDASKRRSVAPSDPEIKGDPSSTAQTTPCLSTQTTFLVQIPIPPGSRGNLVSMPLDSSRTSDSAAAQQRFLSLFLRSEREVYRYVAALVPNPADVEDIVQQTALALWEKFDSYDPSQPFTPWACRFALNKTRQWVERHQRWKALLDGGLAEELAQRREHLHPELEVRLRHLEHCLQRLPAEQRSLVEGYYYRREEMGQLAQGSGRTVASAYKTLQRIRQALLVCMETSASPGASSP